MRAHFTPEGRIELIREDGSELVSYSPEEREKAYWAIEQFLPQGEGAKVVMALKLHFGELAA